jgi:hypothetical protein
MALPLGIFQRSSDSEASDRWLLFYKIWRINMGTGRVAEVDSMGYSKTAVIEARVDIRDLANFAKHIIDGGDTIQSKSDLVWRAFRSISMSLEADGQVLFQSTEEAIGYMDSIGLTKTNRPGRGGRPMNTFTLAKRIQVERSAEGAAPSVDDLVAMIKSGRV